MANELTQTAMYTRNLTQAGIPSNIVQQAAHVRSLLKERTAPNTVYKSILPNTIYSFSLDTPTQDKLITAAQQLAKSIIATGGQAYGASVRDANTGNMTFAEFASLAKQNATSTWGITSEGFPYPKTSKPCAAYAMSLYGTGVFGLGKKGQDKKSAELDKTLKKLDLTTLSNGTSAASTLNTVLKMCYEGVQNVPQDVSQKLNNALSIVAKNVQKDNQTPDKRYTAAFVNWCIQNSTSYTMAWLRQSFPNPAETFKSALAINEAQAANVATNAANTIKVK